MKLIKIFLLPIILFVINCIILILNLHENNYWISILEHFLGGLFISYSYYSFILFLQDKQIISPTNSLTLSLFIISLTGTTTVLWELAEFMVDYFFDIHMQLGLGDTMLDMALGILGSITALVYIKYYKDKKTVQSHK